MSPLLVDRDQRSKLGRIVYSQVGERGHTATSSAFPKRVKMMLEELRGLIAQLRFRGMEAALDAEIERAERDRVVPFELLYRMLAEEAASKRQRKIGRA